MKRKIIICSILVFTLFLFIIINHKQKSANIQNPIGKNVYYIEVDPIYSNPSLEEMSGLVDNVFIVTVEKVVGNYYNEEKDLMPYTTYKVIVDQNYKGNLMKEIIISKNGGYDKKGDLYLIDGMDVDGWRLVLGEKYLLFAFVQENGELLISSTDGTYRLKSTSLSVDFKTIEIYSNDLSKKHFNGEFQKIVDNEIIYERPRYTSKYDL